MILQAALNWGNGGMDASQIYLKDIVFQTNMLVDRGDTASFSEVHEQAERRSLIQWLSDRGADMSILLSPEMSDVKILVDDAMANAADARKGSERRKLGVKNNGLCLLIALALEAITFDA